MQEVYELVVTALRRYRGAMAADEEGAGMTTDAALLHEVRAIREMMETRE